MAGSDFCKHFEVKIYYGICYFTIKTEKPPGKEASYTHTRSFSLLDSFP